MSLQVKPPRPAPNPDSARQGAYADQRRAWRNAVDQWLAAGRPDFIELSQLSPFVKRTGEQS